ncbi:phosphate transporter PHO1 homolog 10-like [Silene latifolia]|uniref:phosphate transporter PHO1 homolog 10-like n=1 Tax=Silene latifolia TaxID=37657 RepID=UPI003D76CB87
MKFGKDFKRQMVPEWVEAYMDYNGLKQILKEIRLSRVPRMQQTPLRSLQHKLSMYSLFSGLDVESKGQESKGDVEDQVIKVSPFVGDSNRTCYRTKFLLESEELGGELQVKFFRKLDEELNKVNAFYKEKVEEVMKEAVELNKQMSAFIALKVMAQNQSIKGSQSRFSMEPLRAATQEAGPSNYSENDEAKAITNPATDKLDFRKFLNHVTIHNKGEGPSSVFRGFMRDSKDKELSFSRQELKEVQERLRVVFTEFYQKLKSIKNFSFINLFAFSKIMKKYEKTTSRHAARLYMTIVDKSYLGNSDEVTKLMENAEHLFIKHLYNANRREGMKPLRIQKRREMHRVTFFSGFFAGCSIALVIAVILMVRARRIFSRGHASPYLENMFGLYSIFLYIVLHLLMYAVDIYFWKRFRVNYPFIFNFKQGTELRFREVFFLSTGLAVLALAGFLANINLILDVTTEIGNPASFAKFIPLLVALAFVCTAFCPFNILYRSSRFFLIKCVFRCICAPFYEVKLQDFFLADQLTSQIQAIRIIEFYICYYSQPGFYQGQSECHDSGIYNAFYFILAIVPYMIRFLQCIRRLFQEEDRMHGYNALKYLTAVVAVVMRTVYELKKGTPLMVMALLTSAMAVAYNTYWDLVLDWGLLRRNSKNFYLRDKLLVSHKSVYYIAMVINVLLRATWLQYVLEFNVRGLRKSAFSTTISCLEIIRRGMWNFFRLENEHLNNVGKFRAFRSVPLPFHYHDETDNDEEEEEEADEEEKVD